MPGYEYVYQGINILPHRPLIYILINGESTIKKMTDKAHLTGVGWKCQITFATFWLLKFVGAKGYILSFAAIGCHSFFVAKGYSI